MQFGLLNLQEVSRKTFVKDLWFPSTRAWQRASAHHNWPTASRIHTAAAEAPCVRHCLKGDHLLHLSSVHALSIDRLEELWAT